MGHGHQDDLSIAPSSSTGITQGQVDDIPKESSGTSHSGAIQFETLAQMAIILMTSRTFPAHRLPICLKSLSDNTGAESGSNKLFSTAMPQCLFLERLCTISAMVGIEIDVGHIPGEMNDRADALSRWETGQPIPFDFKPRDRFRFSLRDIWIAPHKVSLFPPTTPLLWTLTS